MKKLLTFLTLFTLSIGVGWAMSENFVFSTLGYNNQEVITTVNGTNVTITFDKGTNNSNAPKYYTSGTAVRCYGGNFFTVSSTKTITKIVLTFGSSDGSNAITTDVNTYSSGTWTGSASSVKFTIGGTSGNRRIAGINVEYETGGSTVATPTFSPDGGTYTSVQTVTISSTTPNATIYYTKTANGEDPTTSSTSIASGGTVEIGESCVLRAMAVADGFTNSSVKSATYTINLPQEVSTVAEIVALADGTPFTFTGNLVVSGQATASGHKYLYAQDATGGMLFFDANQNYESGDLIPTGFTGTKTTYNGAPEVTNADMSEAATHDQTLTAEELTPDGIIAVADGYNVFEYSVIKGATITLESGKYYINVGDKKVLIYDRFGHEVPSGYEDKVYDVYGVSGWYNGAQFMPLDYDEKVITKYAVTCADATNGEISTDKEEYAEGEIVAVTVTPDPGYELASLVYNDGSNHNITATDGVYSFAMPASNVTVTATFAKAKYSITYNVLPENSGTVWIVDGGNDINGVRMAEEGTRITIKQVQYSGYFMNTLTIKDAEGNTISYDTGDTNNYGDGYGTYFMFDMPASNVIITATFKPGNMYILGTVNDKEWAGNDGVQMNYDSENEKWTADVYINDADAAFSFTEWLGDEWWNNMGPRYGAESNDYNLTQHGYSGTLYGDRYNNAFLLPAGIYTIEIDKNKTTVTVTKVEPTLTFTPAPGEYTSETEVSLSSNLYELLHAINSNIAETDVTNMVKTDGDYAASVTLDADATVTGRAKYGYIEKTATAEYTIMQENTSTQYQLITNTDALDAGKKYLLVCESGPYAYIGGKSGENIEVVDHVTDISGTNGPNVKILILGSETIDGTTYYNFSYTDNGDTYYLANVSAVNDGIGTTTELNDKARWTVTAIVSETGNATIINKETGRHLRAYKTALDFRSYNGASNQTVQLYRQTENTVIPTVATPEFNPGTGTYSSTQNVTITCETQGATILYSTDGENFTEYTAPIPVSETSTLYAKATKDGYNASEVASATYTFLQPGSDVYVLVTSEAQLIEGNEYVIVAATDNHDRAFGAISSSSGQPALGFTNVADHSTITLTENSDVNVLTLGKEGTGDYCWTFKQKNNKYIYAETGGNRINENGGDSYSNLFYISINPGNYNDIHYATIQAGGGHQIMYNGSSFRHWASSNLSTTPGTYKNVYLYTRATEVTPETVTLAELVTKDVNKKYTIVETDAAGLLCVKVIPMADNKAKLICKDNGHYARPDELAGQNDYMGGWDQYDQSNWIALNVSNVTADEPAAWEGYMINGIQGKLENKENPEMTLDSKPTAVGDKIGYDPNTYIVPSFYGTQPGSGDYADETYFFVQPKPMEYVFVKWAQWDGSKFVIPTETGEGGVANAYGLTGSFGVDWSFIDNPGLTENAVYQMKGVAMLNTSKAGNFKVSPTEITDDSQVITGVNEVARDGATEVARYNVAGMRVDSNYRGVVIIVMSDGSARKAVVK